MSRHVRDVLAVAAETKVPTMARAVLAVIAAHADRHAQAWPSEPLVAELLAIHVDTVWRAVRQLEAAGLVAVERTPGRANRYRLAVAAPLDVVHTPRADAGADSYPHPAPARGTPRGGAGRPPAPARAEVPRKYQEERRARWVQGSGWLTG